MPKIGQPYTAFSYLENPYTEVLHRWKPTDAMARNFLARFEAAGWWAQLKYNGTRSGVYVSPDRQVDSWNRHHERHRSWHFNATTAAIFTRIRGRQWFVFDGELMNAKTEYIKNTHYLYDLLVSHGRHLTSTTYEYRYGLLESMFEQGEAHLGHWVLDQYTWLARSYTHGFYRLYREAAEHPEVEGLVLKNPSGIYNTSDAHSWMIKIRYK